MEDILLQNTKDIDKLTNIYRRDVVISYMDALIANNVPYSYLILDVDNFKTINDNFGHHVGDLVLKEVAKSLKDLSKDKGVVARYGGDEFIFVYPNIQEYKDIWQICFDIVKSTANLVIHGYENIQVTYTIGEARFPLNSNNIDELMILADKALYRGKIKGRNCFIIYLPEKHANIKLEATREKVYTPILLQSKIYSILTNDKDYKKNIQEVINFIGAYLLIENLCIETNNEILYTYTHPLVEKRDLNRYGYEMIEQCTSNGIFVENAVINSKKRNTITPLIKEMLDNNIYSSVIYGIKAFDKTYGYLRAEVISLDTGRIWQNDDLLILSALCNYIGLLLYSLKVKELD